MAVWPHRAMQSRPTRHWGCPALTDRLITRSGYISELSVVVVSKSAGCGSSGCCAAGAVVPGNLLHDGPAGFGLGRLRLRIDQFALQRGEEGFGQGVVQHWPLRPVDKVIWQLSARATDAAEVPGRSGRSPGAGSRTAATLASAPAT